MDTHQEELKRVWLSSVCVMVYHSPTEWHCYQKQAPNPHEPCILKPCDLSAMPHFLILVRPHSADIKESMMEIKRPIGNPPIPESIVINVLDDTSVSWTSQQAFATLDKYQPMFRLVLQTERTLSAGKWTGGPLYP